MNILELRDKWAARASEWQSLGVQVQGSNIAREILADLESVQTTRNEELLTPTEAAAATNYHPESIARLVRTGKVKNYGSKHRPRVKLADLPRKAARKPAPVAREGASGANSAANSIARDAIAGRIGRA